MTGAPGVASGVRDSVQSGDSAGSVERTGFHPSSRTTRASMLLHVCAQEIDELERKIPKSGAQWPHFADSRLPRVWMNRTAGSRVWCEVPSVLTDVCAQETDESNCKIQNLVQL